MAKASELDPEWRKHGTDRQAQFYDAVAEHGSILGAARALDISPGNISDALRAMKRRASRGDTPLSERTECFHEHWTADDCSDHLRKFWKDHGDEEISRAKYRRESGVSESTWNRYFGTFEEFKRQAGVKLSRGARQLELHIAKHASRDPMEAFGEDRARYAGMYQKPTSRRWKTALVGSDFHDLDCDPMVRRLFIETARRVHPDAIVLNGDMLDLPEFGRFTVDPRTWDVLGRIAWLHAFLKELREAAPESELIYLEGNHEFRLLRHLAEATPALKTLLADLHGFTMPKLLGLDAFEVRYIGKANLKAWSNRDVDRELHANTLFLWESVLADHFPTGIDQGVPGWNGHHHKWKTTPLSSRTFGSTLWVQMAGGHVRQAEYCAGEKWHTGFMLVHVDTLTKRSVFEPVEVRDFAVVGGEFYFRQDAERWHKGQDAFEAA